jgi:nucleoside-diphosphate-sugar epimerase
VRPTDVNGINKAAGEYYHLVYNNVFGVRGCSLRLTNVYGPRSSSPQPPGIHRLVHPAGARGPGNPDLRRRLADSRLRLRRGRRGRVSHRGADDGVNGEAFNVGGDEHIAHRDLVKVLVELAGSGRYRFVEWPEEKRAIDIGSFYADSTLFRRRTGWVPTVSLRDGLARTLEYYRKHLDRYVGPAQGAGR